MRRHHMSSNRMAAAMTLALAGVMSVAAASEGPKDKGSAGGGASSPGAGTGESSNQAATGTGNRTQLSVEDVGSLMDKGHGKAWEVGASWETHGLLWLTNTGNASRRWFNYGYAFASLNVTKHDRFRLRGGITEAALSDLSETGWRATDPSLSYTHTFDLPHTVFLRLSVAATAGVGYQSWKTGIYTAPTADVGVSKTWNGLTLSVDAYGGAFVARCRSSCSGNGEPNPLGVFGISAAAEYSFWFHKPLAIGLDAFTSYVWYYEVGTQPEGTYYGSTSSMKTPGASGDPRFTSQPAQQQYGGEIYLRYTPPAFYGVKPELLLALSDGGSALGSNSVLIDGRPAILLNYWQSFEAYGAVTFRY
jgi:hypothetical protein